MQRPEHGGPSPWGKPWLGGGVGAGAGALALGHEPGVFLSGRRRWTDPEVQMLQDLKIMMFETNAFAWKIIRGDSSLSGVERFWKLDYNI